LDLGGNKWREAGEDCTTRCFITCTLPKISLGSLNQGGCDRRGHVACMGYEKCIQCLVITPEGKGPLGRPRRRWKNNIKNILGKQGGKVWTGRMWLRIGSSGGLL